MVTPAPLLLGKAKFSSAAIARLTPLVRMDAGAWIPITDVAERFPPEGTIFTNAHIARGVSTETVFQFTAEPNRRAVADDGFNRQWDRQIAVNVTYPFNAVDLSGLSNEEVRRLIVEEGLSKNECPSELLHIKLSDDLWVRFRMKADDKDGKIRPKIEENLERVTLLRPTGFVPFADIGGINFISADTIFTETGLLADWSSDRQFAAHMVKRVRKILTPSGSGKFASDEAGEALTAYLRASELLPNSRNEVVAFRDRLHDFLSSAAVNLEAVKEIYEIIASSQPITTMISTEAQKCVDAIKRGVIDEVTQRAREDWERDNAQLVQMAKKHRSEAEAAESQYRTAIGRLSEQKRKIEAVENNLMSLVDGLREVLARHPKNQTERARAIARQIERGLGIAVEGTLFPGETAPWNLGVAVGTDSLAPDQLEARFADAATLEGFDARQLVALDVAMRAGEIPILAGSEAERFVDCYSRVVAGGRIRHMPIDPGIIGLDDIWRQPGTGKPTALAYAWSAAASNPSEPVMVLLQGIEGAEDWQWCSQLASVLRSPQRPRNFAVVAVVGETTRRGDPSLAAGISQFVPFLPTISAKAQLSYVKSLIRGELPKSSVLRYESLASPISEDDQNDFLAEVILEIDLPISITARIISIYRSARAITDQSKACEIAREFAQLSAMVGQAGSYFSTTFSVFSASLS